MKLMVVDDSNIMRRAISQYLHDFNLELVGTAGDGRAALEMFRERMPDVVTLDITMPEIDGLQCLEEFLKLKPDTRVMVITALADEPTALRALKLGARAFLNKPFTEDSLKAAFRDMLEEPD